MAKYPTFLEQFRSFYFQNNPKDIEVAIEYFSIFGGMGWSVDTSKPLLELIESKVLKNYTYIHGDITKVTNSDKVSHSCLVELLWEMRERIQRLKEHALQEMKAKEL